MARKFRHYVFRSDGGYETYHSDAPISLADDSFDTRTEAWSFIVGRLEKARDDLNEELRRARFNLKREKQIETSG